MYLVSFVNYKEIGTSRKSKVAFIGKNKLDHFSSEKINYSGP